MREDAEISGAEVRLPDSEIEAVIRFCDPRSLDLPPVRVITGAAVKIEPDRLRCIVDINLRRGDVVDEKTVRQIEDSILMGVPRPLDCIRDGEPDVAAVLVRGSRTGR